jgi:homoserine acetyltransferase
MTTYRSAGEFAELRFSAAPVRVGDRFRFPVEEYLFARGDRYVQRYRPESFSDAQRIDRFVHDRCRRVSTPATLFAVREDLLVPLADMHAFAAVSAAGTS